MTRIAPVARALVGWLAAACFLVAAQPASSDGSVGWLGLFNSDLVGWLENENRLSSLCEAFASGSAPWHRCRDDKLAPKVHAVPLRTSPSDTVPSAGSLVLVATPGKGLRAFFVGAQGGAAAPFEPDLFDPDWGYGPYFHQTIVERRGDWIRLPEGPFPAGTWIDTTGLAPDPSVVWLTAGLIVSSPLGDLYILAVEREVVRARPEQPADMWCEAGDPPPLTPWQEIQVPVNDLYTVSGHLRLRVKYTRGC